MNQKLKKDAKQIIDFANHVVNPNDKDYIRGRRLTDKEFQRMVYSEYIQAEDRIDQWIKKLLEDEVFKQIIQPNSSKKSNESFLLFGGIDGRF